MQDLLKVGIVTGIVNNVNVCAEYGFVQDLLKVGIVTGIVNNVNVCADYGFVQDLFKVGIVTGTYKHVTGIIKQCKCHCYSINANADYSLVQNLLKVGIVTGSCKQYVYRSTSLSQSAREWRIYFEISEVRHNQNVTSSKYSIHVEFS